MSQVVESDEGPVAIGPTAIGGGEVPGPGKGQRKRGQRWL